MHETAGELLVARTDAPLRAVVAIPVSNERAHISECLSALAGQVGISAGSFGILLFLNNCTDDTAIVIAGLAIMPCPVRILTKDHAGTSAGWARRIAMNAALDWLDETDTRDGVILTTDADTRVGADWVGRNLAIIAAGADCVAGRISLDPKDAAQLPEHLHARGRLEARYEALLIEIDARLDPTLGDPWPCHWSKSGATIAVRSAAYRQVGGMPDIPTGEDRAFINTVRAHGLIVRHAPEIEVVTSGRLEGRASGGVADTMRLRCEMPESPCDDRLEALHRLIARVCWRRWLRMLHSRGWLSRTRLWAPPLGISRPAADAISTRRLFGEAYAAVEASSAFLVYRPLRPAELPRQIRRAAWCVAVLRAFSRTLLASSQAAGRQPAIEVSEMPSMPGEFSS